MEGRLNYGRTEEWGISWEIWCIGSCWFGRAMSRLELQFNCYIREEDAKGSIFADIAINITYYCYCHYC